MPEKYDFLEIEKRVMDFWRANSIYQKAKERNAKNEPFYFLDGPPYTSGKVHVGTAWNKSLKDAILRYKRMRGYDVWDRAGYDMHGLPTENATQKKLGLRTKEEIYSFGVERFIEECKKLCLENMKVMNADFTRLGVWMDFENAYQSISRDFIDGEWWLIKKAYEKGRLYEGLRTMTWCPISESSLAKHELEYQTISDMSVFVKFKVSGREKEFLIIWTTTPWTLPLNLAVMANPDVEYVKAQVGDEIWIVAGALANVFISGVADKRYSVISTMMGIKLEGLSYIHPFQGELQHHFEPLKKKSPKVHTIILSSEFVDTSAGTGLVHCAPGCGPEDYEAGYQNGIAPFNPIDTRGVFPASMGPFTGLQARKDDSKFIDALESKGVIVAKTIVEHEYPHDWRHHNPVIFRTTKQWFFKVEDIKERMISDNNAISWVPKAAFNAFDSWLRNLRDNSISKQRFWGTPLPIWRNIENELDYLVVGSGQELEMLSGVKVDDLHIPTVDKIKIVKDGKRYERVKDVLDVWVDAGSASWNCLYYPKREDLFEKLFPADFILEGKDQIRGWFNLLMVASTLAFGRPSFTHVYMHGFVQDSQGRKMSKSLGNYILPEEVISQYGADTFRCYTIGGAKAGIDLNYNFEDMKVRHRNLAVLWNVHQYLLDLCRNNDISSSADFKFQGKEEKYILSRLHDTIAKATELMDNYRIDEVPGLVEEIYLDLSRTYIKLTRDKTSIGEKEEKLEVACAIHTVLMGSLQLLAPFAPFITEAIYQNLRKSFSLPVESIHLFPWPVAVSSLINHELESEMQVAQSLVQSILAGREKMQRGVRWPVKEVLVVFKDEGLSALLKRVSDMVMTQSNVKKIRRAEKIEGLKYKVKVNFNQLGADFGSHAASIITKISQESAESIIRNLDEKQAHLLKIGENHFELKEHHLIIEREFPPHLEEVPFLKGFIYLDKEITDELEAEGFSREIMRRVQSLRKNAGLEKKDKIALVIQVDEDLSQMLSSWESAISEKVGAVRLKMSSQGPAKAMQHSATEKVKGYEIKIWFDVV